MKALSNFFYLWKFATSGSCTPLLARVDRHLSNTSHRAESGPVVHVYPYQKSDRHKMPAITQSYFKTTITHREIGLQPLIIGQRRTAYAANCWP